MYYIYDENRHIISKTPIKEQAIIFCINKSKRDEKIYGRTNDIGNISWYGKGKFICNNW